MTGHALRNAGGGQIERQGHIFKSTDGGQSWTDRVISFTGESTNSLFMLHLFVGPNGIVYLADLERGVARSLDGGSTWILRNDGLPRGDSLGMTIVGVSSLKMDPADPSTLNLESSRFPPKPGRRRQLGAI